jgi:hypothetical protein
MGIVKQDPPESRQYRKGVDWEEVVKTLKATPNQFFLIGEFSPGIAGHIRGGKYKPFLPAGETDPKGYMKRHYEVTARTHKTGASRIDLYLKWMP